ncbi:MAG: hypothetical protein RLZZ184_545 [Cyanobacteriota bacterium]|jgi:hypothetical protein
MTQIKKILAELKNNSQNVNFTDLVKVCTHYFGEPRQQGTSHCVYKMPWGGGRSASQHPKRQRKGKALSS